MAIAPFAKASPPLTTLSASPSPARLGQTVVLTATLTPPSSGIITFYDGAAIVGLAPVTGGVATLSTAALAAGKHSLTARYVGSTPGSTSLSTPLALTVQSLAAANLLPSPAFGPTMIFPQLSQLLVVDLNHDLIPDLVIAGQYNYPNSNQAEIFIGTGTGSFVPGASLAVNSWQAAAGDFNGDGNVDLAFTTGTTATVEIFLGGGDGSFTSFRTIDLSGDGGAFALQAADFNNDGKVDLIVSGEGNVATLLGNGDGTFGPATITVGNVSSYETTVLAADFNGDGVPDVITVGDGYPDEFFAGVGDGSFLAGVPLNCQPSLSLVAADFNGDGKLDLLSESTISGSQVLLGQGNGTFSQPLDLTASYSAVGDLNGDGKLDLISGGGVAYGNGDGTFQPNVVLTPSAGSLAGLPI